MAICDRFSDENYKNWLKTTMSLRLLRHGLGHFIEEESETYHRSLLRNLGDAKCERKCHFGTSQPHKYSNLCETCANWKQEIFNNHKNNKGPIYWDNCEPDQWSKDKWEVAKAYMPRGNKRHNRFEQFDISAVLNFMNFCKHFNKLVNRNFISEVINVRNQMMHCPDMKVAGKDMEKHFGKVLKFVEHLQKQDKGLHKLTEDLKQLQDTELSIALEGDNLNVASSKENIQTLFKVQNIQDLEQNIFKEKLQLLTDRLEEDKKEVKNVEIAGIRTFLEQNKDLLEQLGPQVQKLNEIQAKVDEHEQQLSTLSEKVGDLEKKASEPVLSADVVMYKNQILEEATKRNWPNPQFSEKYHSQGYKGQLEINGHKFEGKMVHRNKTAAHQEVAKMALEQLEELSKDGRAAPAAERSAIISSAAPPTFYVTVKVPVNTEFSAGAADAQEDAAEGTYRALAGDLALEHSGPELPPGRTKKLVLDFFSKAGCKPPVETYEKTQEGTFKCTLAIHGDFTFQNQEGTSTKKQAEQEAAKEALTRLSRVLGWNQEDVKEGNYKGKLKELLDKQKKQPTYQILPGVTDISNRAADGLSSGSCSAEGPVCEAAASVRDAASVAIPSDACSQWPSPPQKSAKIDCPDIQRMLGVYGLKSGNLHISSEMSFGYKVQINFRDDVLRSRDAHMTKKDAKRKLYLEFAKALSLGESSTEEHKAINLVKEYFKRHAFELPSESYETKDDKFVCLLALKSFCFSYESRESSEEAAKREASRLAFSRLAPLLGHPAAVRGSGTEAERQLALLLQAARQSDPVFQPLPAQHKATATLGLSGFSLESRGQDKSSARSRLSCRILRLLGEEEASSNISARNQLDDWFKKKGIEQPKFENTQDGVKTTFSAPLTFSHPGWENSWKDAESRLTDVMKARLSHLSEDTN